MGTQREREVYKVMQILILGVQNFTVIYTTRIRRKEGLNLDIVEKFHLHYTIDYRWEFDVWRQR